ncbi:uncharacterized protein CC84DRAFT_114891 [Paraphaeosphaeria sporulosa]|uniref:RING-type domain-containing protein n=1 Tax=Paraphaeosphaeria sporulosa TaxID=1460663 RepID=A0A177CZW0_9PLEO|nr:uncharacterized protein CC84DRAFT_114891 [Paraphaeosphaeria sporulosa]OAG12390.1 hypothetical protein CC84DRAFT_114891 [Paraphaeosphaeria sporulosa]
MAPYADKSAFLANGLKPYHPSPPHTPPASPPATEATSGPLFGPVAADTPPTPPPASPTTDLPFNIVVTDTPADPASCSAAPSEATCPICLDPLSLTLSAVRIRACTHAYHEACLSLWVDRRNTCPACRSELFTAPPRPRQRAQPGSITAADLPPRRPRAEARRPASRRWTSAVKRPRAGHWGENGDWVEVRADMPGPLDDTPPARRAGVTRMSLHPGASEGAGRQGGRFIPGRRRGPRGSGRDVSPEEVEDGTGSAGWTGQSSRATLW